MGTIWVFTRRQGLELVDLQLDGKKRSFAANVGDTRKHLLRQLALYAQTPLLHVGPHCPGRDGRNVQREHKGRTVWSKPYAAQSGWVRLSHVQNCRRTALE